MALMNYLLQIANASSQLLNTFLGGWSDESVSSRSWRMSSKSKGWATMRVVIDFLFRPFGPHHCEGAYFNERHRLNMPPELRNHGSV